ncbi:MAG: polysaccharide biosynthesis protein [Clostridia bacterium]|nr:polysaccharide biosynthesis protein [Clostridia bacterium]
MSKDRNSSSRGKLSEIRSKRLNIKWALVLFDLIIFASCTAILYFTNVKDAFPLWSAVALLVSVYFFRFLFRIYSQVWRYGIVQSYVKLLMSDAFACASAAAVNFVLPQPKCSLAAVIAVASTNLLLALGARIIYSFCYKHRAVKTVSGSVSRFLLAIFGMREHLSDDPSAHSVNIAIIGAGNDGTALAEALTSDENSIYKVKYFIDTNKEKIGRRIFDISIISEDQVTAESLTASDIKELVFALPDMPVEEKKAIYEKYKAYGCKLKVYEKSALLSSENSGRIRLREFDIEDLLFRNTRQMIDDRTVTYYKDKVILVTGGGGSIGSELCRQIAGMKPRMLILLDVYENGVYDVQQELKTSRPDVEVRVEIVSVCNEAGLEKVFRAYQPHIVLHAAAHKHVPLMEKNCVEAIENNVFGTYNVIRMCEKYRAERFIMISTDKAVNPTNVMGATKRVCEMITQCYAKKGSGTVYSATRFGNVLGSAGSVIPLFKRQIAGGGPVTVTDKRINRYFMTIPEASQLVLQSGAMAKNGELFVLDMGQPVKILDLAENMIKLSGYVPYKDIDIIETGLRPGEKLYEELLVKTEELDKTDNSLIFIERDAPLSPEQLNEKLRILRDAADSGSDEQARLALMTVVPTYHTPAEVNGKYYETPEVTEEAAEADVLTADTTHAI